MYRPGDRGTTGWTLRPMGAHQSPTPHPGSKYQAIGIFGFLERSEGLGPHWKDRDVRVHIPKSSILILDNRVGGLEQVPTIWPRPLTPVGQWLLREGKGSLTPLRPSQLWHVQLTVQGQLGSLRGDGQSLTR